jgi:hypothetical protein
MLGHGCVELCFLSHSLFHKSVLSLYHKGNLILTLSTGACLSCVLKKIIAFALHVTHYYLIIKAKYAL